MNNTSVLIYSCDAYSDVWNPFFTLFWRYWDCPFPVYLTTETKKCHEPAVMTLNTQGDTWTERIRKAVEEIPTKYVICMCEDMFFRREVKQDVIEKCIQGMETNELAANFNFEKDYNGAVGGYYAGFGKKPSGRNFQKSCQPTLWRRSVLLELLDVKMNPWEWEESEALEMYEYYAFTGEINDLVFEYGYRHGDWFGIRKGKWYEADVKPLFEKEHINIDLNERGIC